MKDWWQWLSENGALLGWLGILSVIMFVGTLLIIPVLVARIPADYFVDETRHISKTRKLHPVIYKAIEQVTELSQTGLSHLKKSASSRTGRV